MNALDFFILLFVGLGIWKGFQSGVIREVAQLIGLVLAFLMAVRLMEPVGVAVAASMGISDRIAPLVGFVVTFLLVLIAVFFVARALESVVTKVKLGPVNRVAGGVLGGFKAALVLSVFFVLVGRFNLLGALASESQLYEAVYPISPHTWELVSAGWPEAKGFAEKLGTGVEDRLPGR